MNNQPAPTTDEPSAAERDRVEQFALAQLTGKSKRLNRDLRDMRRDADLLPHTFHIEVNKLMAVNDLLRQKLREATLARVVHGPSNDAANEAAERARCEP